MKNHIRWIATAFVLMSATLIYVSGCGNPNTEPTPGAASAPKAELKVAEPKKNGEEHGHKPGAHGGIIFEIGRDSYHGEAIFEKGGVVRLYTLGKDEAKVQDVEAQELTAYAKAGGAAESVTFTLKAQPQPGDASGKTSLFVGDLPKELHGKPVEVTVPSLRINGERFRVGFKSLADSHESGMPAGAEGEEARKLYLVPGGIYTAADIKANGGVTAGQKFAGRMAKHDMKPKAGDKICPVTFTKANPEFTWVVAGKTYEFCCPPCVDEFVGWAKEQPEQIKEPREYVKKK